MMGDSDGGMAIHHSDGTSIKIYRPGQYAQIINVLNRKSAWERRVSTAFLCAATCPLNPK